MGASGEADNSCKADGALLTWRKPTRVRCRRAVRPTAEGAGDRRTLPRYYTMCPGPGGVPSQAFCQSVRSGKSET